MVTMMIMMMVQVKVQNNARIVREFKCICVLIVLFVFLQAKQRASIKWLLSKAYNNKIPEELVDPFYKDHEVSPSMCLQMQRLTT